MKNQIIKILNDELNMTETSRYRNDLESVLEFAKGLGDSFEDNLNLYKRAKEICHDTCPREELFLAKEEYFRQMSRD